MFTPATTTKRFTATTTKFLKTATTVAPYSTTVYNKPPVSVRSSPSTYTTTASTAAAFEQPLYNNNNVIINKNDYRNTNNKVIINNNDYGNNNNVKIYSTEPSIMEVLRLNDLTVMSTLLEESGLDQMLNQKSYGSFTIFVPTDSAFNKFFDTMGGVVAGIEKLKRNNTEIKRVRLLFQSLLKLIFTYCS